MKSYVEHVMGNRTEVSSDDLPLESKNELLSAFPPWPTVGKTALRSG